MVSKNRRLVTGIILTIMGIASTIIATARNLNIGIFFTLSIILETTLGMILIMSWRLEEPI